MTTFSIGNPFVADPQQQRNNDDLLTGLNAIAQFIDFGTGAPAHTPTGRRIYVRRDGAAGTTLYCWSGAAWNAFA